MYFWAKVFFRLNNNELLFIPNQPDSCKEIVIYKYHSKNDKWTEFIHSKPLLHLEEKLESNNFSACLDTNKQNIYFFIYPKKLMKINMDSAKFEVISYENENKYFKGIPWTLMIGKNLHIFNTNNRSGKIVQTMYNTDNKKLTTIDKFGLQSHCYNIFHIKSQNVLLFLGSNILSYNLLSKQCESLNLGYPLDGYYGFGSILTNDEKYIITFGGWKCEQQSDNNDYSSDEESDIPVETSNIYILNLDTMKWSKSRLECPCYGNVDALLTDNSTSNDFLLTGFIRNISKGNNKYSLDVVKVMQNYLNRDDVYLFRWQVFTKVELDKIMEKHYDVH